MGKKRGGDVVSVLLLLLGVLAAVVAVRARLLSHDTPRLRNVRSRRRHSNRRHCRPRFSIIRHRSSASALSSAHCRQGPTSHPARTSLHPRTQPHRLPPPPALPCSPCPTLPVNFTDVGVVRSPIGVYAKTTKTRGFRIHQ